MYVNVQYLPKVARNMSYIERPMGAVLAELVLLATLEQVEHHIHC